MEFHIYIFQYIAIYMIHLKKIYYNQDQKGHYIFTCNSLSLYALIYCNICMCYIYIYMILHFILYTFNNQVIFCTIILIVNKVTYTNTKIFKKKGFTSYISSFPPPLCIKLAKKLKNCKCSRMKRVKDETHQ